MSNPVLTIAIPTYNRPKQLEHTLRVILPQLVRDERVCLLILDNHSEVPASEVLNSLGAAVPSDRIRVVRNRVNIGGNANIMRCFEFCETQWLWVLGDDDAPSSDAVKTILNDTQYEQCYAFYSIPSVACQIFHSDGPERFFGNSLPELLSHVKNKVNVQAFLSAAVFNMTEIRPFIIDGYYCVASGIPHLIMVYNALNQGGSWMISRKVIADYNHPEEGQSWGFMSLAFSIPGLLGIAGKGTELDEIREFLVEAWKPSPKKIFYYLMSKYGDSTASGSGVRYAFKILMNTYAPSWKSNRKLYFRWKLFEFRLLFFRSYLARRHFFAVKAARMSSDNRR